MLLVGSGQLDAERMLLLILEFFNPILQGEKFDPEGNYVKKWVPEISNLPKEFLHKPWELNSSVSGFEIGKTYPKPIVIHEEARHEALKAFKSLKK